MLKKWMSAVGVVLVAAVTVVAGEINLEGVQCVVASRDAQESKSAEYKEGKVYFCCNGCAGKFTKNPKKFTASANRQLVQTNQYKQTGCPFSGGGVNPETMITVAGTKVGFCCGKCQARVEKADPKAQEKMVFGEKGFEKGFAKAE